MKNKILGMFVCTLLMAAAITTVESSRNNSVKANILPASSTSVSANWTETQKLLASDGAPQDVFGKSVSAFGGTVLIGAEEDNTSKGSAYVYIRNGTTWMQQAKLLASDGNPWERFGRSVSLGNNTALIGSYGTAYVFIRNGTSWTRQAKLVASNGDVSFGWFVSLNRDSALIAATESAYVFTRSGTTWTQQAKLLPSDGAPDDFFGSSVALSGDIALIGAPFDDDQGNASGSAYLFTRSGTVWTQQQKLLASDGESYDHFSWSVALNTDTALIGAIGDDRNKGAVYVFTRNGTVWVQKAKLLASDGAADDWFGYSVALDGDTALIGVTGGVIFGVRSGTAYIFKLFNSIWAQKEKLFVSDVANGDLFGYSVSLSGDTALIGVPYDDDNGNESGSAYVFMREDESPNLAINLWGGIGVNADIKNSGIAMNITWQLEVKGSILGLIHKSSSGVLVVQGGESRWVSTGPFLGIGPFTVVAKANEVEKTAKGIVLLFYVIILT